MGRRLAAIAILGALLGGAAPASAAEKWRPGVNRAQDYAATRSGSISFAVKTPKGKLYSWRGQTVVPAASVLKVMFMNVYLRDARDRKLNDSDKDLLAPMIKRSDNAPATWIADNYGPGPMYRLARDSDQGHFSWTRPWGNSTVTAIEQARYFFHLERYFPNRHEDYARYLISHVTESQRWGIGRLHRPKWKIYFKGGWGSGTGSVCHQVAYLERKGLRIAIAVMITGSPSHEYATETLKGMFKNLLHTMPKPY